MDEKLKEIILKSGNNLHTEVAQQLEYLGWDVEISAYYNDDITDKPREIDIVASRDVGINPDKLGTSKFRVFLLIECKYFKEQVAFRVYENQKQDGLDAIITHGFNQNILDERNTNLSTSHHYISTAKVGKLYDSKDNNEIFQALTGTAKSILFFKEKRSVLGIFYPVVIYDGISGLYEVNDDDLSKLDSLKPTENLLFHLNYSYRNSTTNKFQTQSFFVDVIRKNRLEDFHNLIAREIGEIKRFADFISRQKTIL